MSDPLTACSLKKQPIQTLASYQQCQGTSNNCALHSIATVFNLQFGSQLDGRVLAKSMDDSWTRKPFLYRTYPGWATTPGQAKRIIQSIAKRDNIKVRTRLFLPSDTTLQSILRNSNNSYLIVTILWIYTTPSLITHQEGSVIRMQAEGKPGGHTMLLAAYDPAHTDEAGLPHPWGFINSWATSPSQDIFWMSQDTWDHLIKLSTLFVQFD
ncbi:MAG: hypothetical protein JEY79_19575 [Pseudodesulfovibrio sp.]|nr:hypothetical protein [Pseudodesulfovibrio sp.]